MKETYFIVATSKDLFDLKVKDINFLFPLEEYSVGYPLTYKIEEITSENAFLLINRILDEKSILSLQEQLKQISKTIKGIIFTDLGVLEMLKEIHYSGLKIYMQNHNTTNASSINAYLEDVDSVFLSTDITKEEMLSILDKVHKPLVVPYFILVDAMYSRRTLLKNFQEEFDLLKQQEVLLHEPISNQDFLAIENAYGTVLYAKKFVDYRFIKHKNAKYRFLNPIGLSKECVEDILMGKDVKDISNSGFLEKETYYRLKEEER